MKSPAVKAPIKGQTLTPVHIVNTLLLIGSLLCLSACSSDTDAVSQNSNSSAVSISNMPFEALDAASSTYQDLGGRGFELASFAGQKIFVNYWATWCAPCIRELPALAAAAEALQDEGYLFLLASDESVDTIKEFIAEHGFSGNFVKLNKFFGAWGIEAVPSSSLYNEQGEVLRTWAGEYDWASDEMLDHIRQAGSE